MHRILRPSDVAKLAAEYDAAPDCDDECAVLWRKYADFSLTRQAELTEQFTIYLVNVEQPYTHGSLLLADLVKGQYKVPAPTSCPVHPVWDGQSYAASRTWHDIDGHGYSGVGFTLDEEIKTFQAQATILREWGREELIPVVFSDTMQQLCSTLVHHSFAPQKVALTEMERLLERCLA